MSPLLLIVLICLATYSATRLLTTDKLPLIRVPREWIAGKLRNHWFGYLITCDWCSSVYVAAGIVWAVDFYTSQSVPFPPLLVLLARAVTGWLSNAEGWLEQRWELNRRLTWLANDDMKKRGYHLPEE